MNYVCHFAKKKNVRKKASLIRHVDNFMNKKKQKSFFFIYLLSMHNGSNKHGSYTAVLAKLAVKNV